MKLARIRHRVMATIMDNLIIFGVMLVLLMNVWPFMIYSIFTDVAVSAGMVIKILKAGMIYAIFLLSYYMIIPIFLPGQTLGKKIFRIKVVNEDGSNIDYRVLFFREAICRILVRTISFGFSSVASFIIMLIRDDKKSFADVFANTKVIDIKGE